MKPLPNNCRFGKISVTPKNWDKPKADINMEWKISYRFHDDNLKKKVKCVIKAGINRLKSLSERQAFIKSNLEHLLYELQVKGWNPITETHFIEPEILVTPSFNPGISLRDSLNYAFDKFEPSKHFKRNTGYIKDYFLRIAKALHVDTIPVKDIDERHVEKILEECGKQKKLDRINYKGIQRITGEPWNNRMFNYWRSRLGCLFKILKKEKVIRRNYALDVELKKIPKPDRLVITKEERKKIFECEKIPYTFRRYCRMFFHSGARSSELLLLKKEDVNLTEQYFKITVLKGRESRVRKTIKNLALSAWKEIVAEAENGQYLFSIGLKPGNIAIDPIQITRRWRVHVKDKLGIEADFYSLKHSNADEVADRLDAEAAQKLLGHSSKVVTMEFYLQGEKKRQHERLKKIDNEF